MIHKRHGLIRAICVLAGSGPWVTAAAGADGQQAVPPPESGLAAVYSERLAGHVTADGHHYDPKKLTAAHRSLPFGTHVLVTNTNNGKSVELVIDDRGPRQKERVLDISRSAARALGMRRNATAPVTLAVVQP